MKSLILFKYLWSFLFFCMFSWLNGNREEENEVSIIELVIQEMVFKYILESR